MAPKKVFLYPSLGGSYSMIRYLNGVKSGLDSHNQVWEEVKPKGKGVWSKYILYPLLALKNKGRGNRHLVISERYAYLTLFLGKNSTVVCHDLHSLYNDAMTPKIHIWLYRFFLWCMFKAGNVVCVSNYTKDDLIKYFPKFRNHNQLRTVHNGIEEYWLEPVTSTFAEPDWYGKICDKKILLSVGTDAWYKNSIWTIELLADLDEEKYHLVRVGTFNQANQLKINYKNLNSRITVLSDISDEELKFAYTKATALLFPSLSEGFGWPALEASLCNCPVITSGKGGTEEFLSTNDSFTLLENAKDALQKGALKKEYPTYKLWSDQVITLLS